MPAWLKRLEPIALQLLGDRRVVRLRAVLDLFGRYGGGLLAAGIAFNTLFALIPLAIFVSGLVGILVSDPAARAGITEFLTGLAPPLAALLDEAVGDLAVASTSLTIIGLIGAAWGATRLYASIELGVQAMFSGVKARNLFAKTVRRAVFIIVIVAIIGASILLAFAGSVVGGPGGSETGLLGLVVAIALVALPYILGILGIGAIYRFVPPVRPPFSALTPPAIGAGLAIVGVTQIFTLVAPRLVGANVFYGTLGTVFVALAWLNLMAMILLVGAAWVRVRMLTDEEVAATLE
ncbi:MAG: YihY/virulence factor BrkB family protein [Chloroflexota bacterium]